MGVVEQCANSICTFLGNGIVGTPTSGGVYSFTVRKSFNNGDSFSRDYTLNIVGQPALLPSGALSWWSGERGVLDDLNRSHGSAVGNFGNASFALGKVGLAFSFTGDNSAVQLPDDFFLFNSAGNKPFTFETWFKTTASGVIIGQQNTNPFNSTSLSAYTPGIYVGSDGKLRVEMFSKGAINPITSTNAVNDDAFHHVAVVYDGSQQIVYLDGSEMNRAAHAQQVVSLNLKYQFGTGFTQGWPATNNGWFNFNGLIDEPTLYDRTLSAEEVQSIYAAGNAGKIQITVTPFNPVCPGTLTGVILAKVLGNAVPYSFALDLHLIIGAIPITDFLSDGVLYNLQAGNYTVKVKDNRGRIFTQAVTLTDPAQSISATSQSFSTQGGTGSFNVTSGAGCTWQVVNNNPGFITITTPAGNQGVGSGAVNFSVAANNTSTARTGTISINNQTFTVRQDGAAITATVSGGGTICPGGSATVSVNLTGGVAPYTVTLTNGGGTKMSSSLPITFTVSPTVTTTYAVQSATDGFGSPATANGSAIVTPDNTAPSLGTYPATGPINFGAGATVSPSAPPSDNGSIASVTATAPGFNGTLSVNPATGVVTIANANSAGTFTVTVKATDSCGSMTTRTFTLAVAADTCGITVNPATLPQPYVAVPYARVLSATPASNYTFSVSAGQLPPGLQLVTALGVSSIAGLPTTPGTFNFTIKAKKNGTTCEATRAYTVTIPATVAPILNCVMRNQNGSYTAKFGYHNSTGAAVTIPVGANNYFMPGAQNRGQTTVFQPGVVTNSFSVTFNANGSNLGIWFLRGPDGVLRPVNVLTTSIGCP